MATTDCNEISRMKARNRHEHMESRTRMRRRPLYTCGKSVLATASRAYKKAQDSTVLQGAFTKLLEKATRMARIVFCTFQYHCLAILSATDNWILSAETAVERILPQSGYIFDKVDELVRISESFPERSDVLVTQIISWMEISASALSRWESRSGSEKEIQIDTGHDERPKSHDHTKGDAAADGPTSGAQPTKTETVTKYAPEEGPEKGLKEGVDKREVDLIIGGEEQTRDSDKEKDEETCKKRKDGKSKRGKKKG